MAKIDDLVAQVEDPRLKRELAGAVAELKRNTRFGLVYEEHLPEKTALLGLPVTVGAEVLLRKSSSAKTYRVTGIVGAGAEAEATIEPTDGSGEAQTLSAADLIVVRGFGEPIYPALTPLGEVRRGGDDKPHHAVISGENFHAVQMLLYLYEGQVDCLYLDPPYNTGARDWTYNNAYVDSNDAWRHSKWLSFMEKRLRLARRLLKPDGVMVITIDDYEVHHLRMLIETQMKGLRIIGTAVIKTSPSGRPTVRGFRTNHEYAFFIGATPTADIKPLSKSEEQLALFNDVDEQGNRFAWVNLRKRGGINTHRIKRPKQFYPIYVSEDSLRFPLLKWDNDKRDWDVLEQPGLGEEVVYPIGDDGRERIWSLS
jgi:adenine-specific DNA-methyltransferase